MLCIDLDVGRQAGGRGHVRSKEGWRVGGREQVEDGGGREGSRGGREEGMMQYMMVLGRERASVEEARVEGGWVDEGTERGMDSARERWEGGSERREGLSEETREQGGRGAREGRKLQGGLPRRA